MQHFFLYLRALSVKSLMSFNIGVQSEGVFSTNDKLSTCTKLVELLFAPFHNCANAYFDTLFTTEMTLSLYFKQRVYAALYLPPLA